MSANQALLTAGKLHPDKKIAKAARAALVKANSVRNSARSGDRPALGGHEPRRRRREEPELRVSLVGVSCVGTTTVGRLLAGRRGWPFFDLDEEIERHFGTSIERLQARLLTGYSYRKECAVVLERIATTNPDCVIALPPSGLRDTFLRVIRRVPCVTVAVHDTPENVLELCVPRIASRALTSRVARLALRPR